MPVGAATLRELPLVGETSPELAALVDRAHREARTLNRLLGVHPLALGTVAPADVLGADATAALRTGLAAGLGVAPTAWEDPGVVLAPAADAVPELLHVVLLHTTAVVAGPPALVGPASRTPTSPTCSTTPPSTRTCAARWRTCRRPGSTRPTGRRCPSTRTAGPRTWRATPN